FRFSFRFSFALNCLLLISFYE
ncbi:hypothetical protein, partial [Plasmodium yoelii yoelii]